MRSYTIDFLTFEWGRNLSITIFFIFLFLLIGSYLNKKNRLTLGKSISLFLLITIVLSHIENFLTNQWTTKEHLPLHLCSINALLCTILLFIPRNKILFEFVFYGGVLGGLVALLTPQINDYDGSLFEYLIYYTNHGIIILFPLFLYYLLDFKLTKLSWLRTLIILNILMVIFMPLNSLLGSNYMYVNRPPNVKNPLIIGEWPYYLVNLEIIILILFLITYWLFTKVLIMKSKQI
ncbi:MAG: TIGR02206 family membrane protein [Flavobacteriaceae bacterium]|nr:TIGR02206 family membrane protein [Flavobacteriaceae bacterium]|tara:strand:- start:2106 stop:2810 length:705 start_codon:yes stop_codon:yes gene_type:complete